MNETTSLNVMQTSLKEPNPYTTERSKNRNLDDFEIALLMKMGCLRALNFNHIAFIGRHLDQIPENEAYRMLWHELSPDSQITFESLTILCRKGKVIPWHAWGADWIFTNPYIKPVPKKSGAFYFIGRRGRKLLRKKFGFYPPSTEVDELYSRAFPIARWLTASSCALTAELSGWKLNSQNEVWNFREDIDPPEILPDFIATKSSTGAFYILESPFGFNATYNLAHAARGLDFLSSEAIAVIFTRNKEAFRRTMFKLKTETLPENKERIYIADLSTFKLSKGHCKAVNMEGKIIKL